MDLIDILNELKQEPCDKIGILEKVAILTNKYEHTTININHAFKEYHTHNDYGELIGWVYAGGNRRAVLKHITLYKYVTPKQIAISTKISINHISNLLKDLQDKGLIMCINPNAKRGRTYTLTDLGRTIGTVLRL